MEKEIKAVCPTCGKISVAGIWEKSDGTLLCGFPEEKCPECLLLDILEGTFSLPA